MKIFLNVLKCLLMIVNICSSAFLFETITNNGVVPFIIFGNIIDLLIMFVLGIIGLIWFYNIAIKKRRLELIFYAFWAGISAGSVLFSAIILIEKI